MAVTSTNNLRIGSSGEDVLELQKRLNQTNYGYNLAEDGSFGEKTQAAVRDYQQRSGLDVDGVVGTHTWGALTKANTPATTNPATTTPTQTTTPTTTQTPTEASGFTYQPYTSQWQTQLDETLDKILNREKFSYDLNGDALYQQYKDRDVLGGQMAMMDTMGQAAALTGGYGNSYAQTVGQQTYQGYLQQLNDKVPELYQLALDQYNREGDELYTQYGMYADRDEQDYGRWGDKVNLDYGMHRDEVADKQWQAQFDEAKRQYDQQYALSESKATGKGSVGNTGDRNTTGDGGKYADNEGLTETQVKMMQASLGLDQDGKWGPQSRAAAGGLGAKEAYALWNKGELGKPVNSPYRDTPTAADYAGWDQGDWEHYFSAIRQGDGQAAAEEELSEFAKKGLIPQNMLYYARIGASGKLGH